METGDGPASINHRALYDFSLNELDRYIISLNNERLVIGTTQPGLYAYHNNQPFSTRNTDNDGSPSSCSTVYDDYPWWYVNCWSVSFWGGSTQGNSPYWTGSAVPENWGAFWLK